MSPTTFVGIGGAGQSHDFRPPDYDDWSPIGDLLFWDETLDSAVEISSMGACADAEALKSQLAIAG